VIVDVEHEAFASRDFERARRNEILPTFPFATLSVDGDVDSALLHGAGIEIAQEPMADRAPLKRVIPRVFPPGAHDAQSDAGEPAHDGTQPLLLVESIIANVGHIGETARFVDAGKAREMHEIRVAMMEKYHTFCTDKLLKEANLE
jgi:hypothetical protein